MPAAARDILLQHSGLDLLIFYAKEWDAWNDGIEKRLRANTGHTHFDLNEEEAELWKKALDAATQGWLGTNPKFPALLAMYKEEVAKARKLIAEKGI